MNRSVRFWWLCVALIVCAGIWAYHGSLSAPFIFDDRVEIVRRARAGEFSPWWSVAVGTERPLTDLSLSLNHAIGGLNPRCYRLVNVAIHLIAGLVLFALIRRTAAAVGRLDADISGTFAIALVSSLLWLLHPLQTSSVTYIVQRAEALAGMFLFLTLYAACRGATDPVRAARWHTVGILSCACGMACKPVMVVAPLVVWMYDRVFFGRSWGDVLCKRSGFYLGLAACWVLLAFFVLTCSRVQESVGFEYGKVSAWAYARTQPSVILHYLRLALWPDRLVLDYAWPVAEHFRDIVLPTVGLGAIVAGGLVLWRFSPALGFLGLSWLVMLVPSSSIVPVADLAFEHRMYAALAPLAVLVVLAVATLLRRFTRAHPSYWRWLAACLAVFCIGALGRATINRNAVYRSEVVMWTDVVEKRPLNARAHNYLGLALARQGQHASAQEHYAIAMRVDPSFEEARVNFANTLMQEGRLLEAAEHLEAVAAQHPRFAAAHYNLGVVRIRQGRLAEALTSFEEACRFSPAVPDIWSAIATARLLQGDTEGGIEAYHQALQLDDHQSDAHANLALVHLKQGRLAEAHAHLSKAAEQRPEDAQIRRRLDVLSKRLEGIAAGAIEVAE